LKYTLKANNTFVFDLIKNTKIEKINYEKGAVFFVVIY